MKKTTALRPGAAATPRRSPAPMPGRLPVDYDTALGPDSKPLNDVPTGTDVEVTARIVSLKPLPGHRMALVIGDHNGNTAMVAMDSAAVMAASRLLGRIIAVGHTVIVRGTVARRIPTMPATIDGRAMRAVTR
ncbi:hypothetical protein [Streptomyces asiaticus]|uniref:hypothetical protein n=1 Tax=Streptomyces asiaticus TaxID=114695 RepID=UPI003817273D